LQLVDTTYTSSLESKAKGDQDYSYIAKTDFCKKPRVLSTQYRIEADF